MNKTNIESIFGFDETLNLEYTSSFTSCGDRRMPVELEALQKRVKKAHPLATFRQTTYNILAIRLSPKSL